MFVGRCCRGHRPSRGRLVRKRISVCPRKGGKELTLNLRHPRFWFNLHPSGLFLATMPLYELVCIAGHYRQYVSAVPPPGSLVGAWSSSSLPLPWLSCVRPLTIVALCLPCSAVYDPRSGPIYCAACDGARSVAPSVGGRAREETRELISPSAAFVVVCRWPRSVDRVVGDTDPAREDASS